MIDLVVLRSLAPITAASGLVRAAGHWCVVADDAHALAAFPDDDPGAAPRWLRLVEGELPIEPRARKEVKPDFEALVALPPAASHPHGALLALGSGSRPNRRRGALLPLGPAGALPLASSAGRGVGDAAMAARPIDLSALHDALARALGSLNLEGAARVGDALWLLQRADAGAGGNAVARLSLRSVQAGLARDAIDADAIEAVDAVALGSLAGVPLGFTDASALPDGRVVFVAAAEQTDDPYEDGAVAGSAIGLLSPAGALLDWWPVRTPPVERGSGAVKLEGIAAEAADVAGRTIRLALASDADDPAVPSILYAATLAA